MPIEGIDFIDTHLFLLQGFFEDVFVAVVKIAGAVFDGKRL